MALASKRRKAMEQAYDVEKYYSANEALALIKQFPAVKFTESVDVSIRLGIDARKSDQMIRGSSSLPHGLGKTVKVAVFTQGDNIEKAKAAGADEVGLEDLVAKVEKGNIDWDVVIASPDAMSTLGKLGQVLGPRGLMPNPKDGTVSQDVAQAVTAAKSGQARYRSDKAGVVHCCIGTTAFETNQLEENLKSLVSDIKDLKPAGAKGTYLKKLVVSSTMSAGIKVDHTTL